MATQPQTSAVDVPVRFGTDEQFDNVRKFLLASGFTRQCVQERVPADLPDPVHAQAAEWGRNPASAADLLTWIFVLGQSAPAEQFQRFVPPSVAPAMEALGILARDNNGAFFSPVFLVPIAGLYFACDRWYDPDGSDREIKGDVVYPASASTTLRFLNLLSNTRCERLLDIGCGSGVLGLVAAASARRVWATDITERSCVFTEFNRRLNGSANAQVLQGDLYEPVANQAFNRIIAHPPYVPVLKPNWTFYDGGEDVERLTRQIVEGLPRHLSGGGLLLCDATGSDRDLPFEQRVREWLGERQAEFDIAVLVRRSYEPRQFAEQLASANPTMGTIADWVQSFERQQIRRIQQMTLCIQHAANARPVFTTRRNFGAKESAAAIDWLLSYETHAANAADLAWVMYEKPSVPPWLTLQVSSRAGAEGFTPFECKVTTDWPFASQSVIEPWMATLLNLCNGQRTTAELFQMVLAGGYIPANAAPEQFAGLVNAFAANAILELSSFPLPRE